MGVPSDVFDEDYLYFYADLLGDERSDADADVVARLLSLRPGMRVLDVPCGEGRIAGRLARRGCQVVGIDSSERFVALARERYPGVVFQRGDMRRLPYEAEFDNGDLMVDRITYDQARRRSRTDRFIVRDGHVRRLEFTLEQVPPSQLVRRLKGAGFREVQLFGAGGAPFDPEGPRLIALARR